MQAAFFKVANVIPYEKAVSEMKKAIYKSYGKKGEAVVNMNNAAVDKGGEVTKIEIPAEWADIKIGAKNGYQKYSCFHQRSNGTDEQHEG